MGHKKHPPASYQDPLSRTVLAGSGLPVLIGLLIHRAVDGSVDDHEREQCARRPTTRIAVDCTTHPEELGAVFQPREVRVMVCANDDRRDIIPTMLQGRDRLMEQVVLELDVDLLDAVDRIRVRTEENDHPLLLLPCHLDSSNNCRLHGSPFCDSCHDRQLSVHNFIITQTLHNNKYLFILNKY